MLLDIARATIDCHCMLESGQRVLVAVSGGPDSVALLDVLARLRPDYGIELQVAHLDHMLRPEAPAEAEFVRALAAQFHLPVILEAADVRSLAAREKLSLEHAARNARRDFLLRAAKSIGAERIALGHHADDRVETVLMRILRGTGVEGLGGIRPMALPFIRPFFSATRAQIEEYIREQALPYREDPSNRDPAFLRNRIRWELAPLLEDLQPGFKGAVLRLSELARADDAWMFVEAAMVLAGSVLVERTPERITLRLAALSRIVVPAKRRRVVREAMRLVLGRTTDVEHAHVQAVIQLVEQGKTGKRLHLPHRLIAERGYGTLILRIGEAEAGAPIGEFALKVPGETEVAALDLTILAEVLPRAQARTPAEEPPSAAQLDYDGIAEPLVLRTWRRGDRFQPLGMTGSMKVHDFFVNEKIPRAERKRVPIVTSGGEIAWIVGRRIDDRFKVTDATATVLRLEAHRRGE